MHRSVKQGCVLAAVIVAAACGGSDDGGPEAGGTGTDEIRIASFSEGINYECFYTALDQGFFADENVTIPDPVVFGTDDETARALIGGEVDLALAGPAPLVAMESGGEPLKAIASIGGPMFAFVAPPSVASLDDLRGQTMVLAPEGTSSTSFASAVLDAELGDGNWESLPISGGSPARVAAVQAGQGQATVLNTPAAETVEAQGEYSIVSYLLRDLDKDYETGGVYASTDWLEANEDLVVRFLRAWDRGCEYMHDPANRAEVESGFVERYEVPDSAATAIYDEYLGEGNPYGLDEAALDQAALQNTVDLSVESGVMTGSVDLSEVVDNSYLEQAREN